MLRLPAKCINPMRLYCIPVISSILTLNSTCRRSFLYLQGCKQHVACPTISMPFSKNGLSNLPDSRTGMLLVEYSANRHRESGSRWRKRTPATPKSSQTLHFSYFIYLRLCTLHSTFDFSLAQNCTIYIYVYKHTGTQRLPKQPTYRESSNRPKRSHRPLNADCSN